MTPGAIDGAVLIIDGVESQPVHRSESATSP